MIKLDDYQQRALAFVLERDGSAGLFLDMGLGKTAVAIAAVVEYAKRQFTVRKTLIVAPLLVAQLTWPVELAKWAPELSVAMVVGPPRVRTAALQSKADVYITNRENLVWVVKAGGWDFDMVILDESSGFKSARSKRFAALRTALRRRPARVLLLSGTPAPQSIEDYWSQLWLLDGGARLGRTLGDFRASFCRPIPFPGFVKYVPRAGADARVRDIIADICISAKAEDYIALPGIVYQDITVQLSPDARVIYERLERDACLLLSDAAIAARTAAALLNKLAQAANGAVYDDERGVHELHEDKLDRLVALVHELCGAPALVFYAYQHDLERIRRRFAAEGIEYRALEDGADASAWNAGECAVLLAHPASAAYGLNLQDGGSHVVWFGLTYNLEHYLQANKRLHRRGQQAAAVFVHRLISAGTVDERIAKALENKTSVQEFVLTGLTL